MESLVSIAFERTPEQNFRVFKGKAAADWPVAKVYNVTLRNLHQGVAPLSLNIDISLCEMATQKVFE